MQNFDPLLEGLDFEEEQVEGFPLEKLSRNQSLVDIDNLIVVVKQDIQ